MKKLLFLSNIPTPYQIDFLEVLSRSLNITAVFLRSHEPNRDWHLLNKPWLHVLAKNGEEPKWVELLRLLKESDPSDVLIGGYKIPFAIKLSMYCFSHGIRYHYWLESPLPANFIKSLARKVLLCLALPLAKQVFCIGQEAMAAYKPYAKKTINLPYSINSSKYIQRSGIPELPIKFVYIGQYIPRKGVAELLAAFSRIAPDHATLTIIGSGALKFLVQKYSQMHENIIDVGFIEPSVLPELLSRYDVLVAPSHRDGWAVVVVEAMMAALPVISTLNTGAFLELGVFEGEDANGVCCQPDPDSIYKAINRYIKEPERVMDHGKRGYQIANSSSANSEIAAQILLSAIA
jgi:glycosyltransferase involved in cell wall biosynthesis